MTVLLYRDYICYNGRIDSLWSPKISMTFAQPNRTDASVPLPVAAFRAWVVRAGAGEWLEYHRGLLAIDRIEGSALTEPERRKLNAVADLALALAGQGTLHLLQERHPDGDYSYLAVARALVRGGQT
jgi:hypothetical protein